MKKALIIVGVIAGAALLARRFAPSCGQFNFEQMIERMPEDAPPKWMFRNITAIRENTDRILELLESGRVEPARQTPPPPPDH
jgi:hypothetical protein